MENTVAKDLLVELGTEELPPKALKTLALAFKDGICAGLEQQGLTFANARFFASPRRLALIVEQLAEQAPDKDLEIHGPPLAAARDKNGEWTKAAIGFAQKNGVNPEQLEIIATDKGDRLGVRSQVKGASAKASLQSIVENALNNLPIPKRMRWGSGRAEFVRPVHWLVMLYGDEVVDATVLGLKASNQSRGHRFHCDTDLEINTAADYETLLEIQGHVIPDFSKRRDIIRRQVAEQSKKLGAEAVIDENLLDEVTALVEWPVALTASFEERFLEVPAEALISTMKENQKYFHVVDKAGKLMPNFIFISNIESNDPSQVIQGNEKVVRPRLSDAAFFFETDKQIPLSQRVEKLQTVVFQQQLGTVYDKALRVQSLAGKIAVAIDGNVEYAERAALLAKADLVSSMVLEFDTMQGLAGRYYALHDGEASEVAEAIAEQYLPRFAGDTLPANKTACALALADRLDTLVGIFGIGQAPTGSKDPFALRRAALAVLRILVEKEMPLDLATLLAQAKENYSKLPKTDEVIQQVLDYCIERFRAWYEDAGIPVQVFQAVSARNVTVPVDFDARVKAVHAFSQLEQAQALAAANKRVANILAKQNVAGTLRFDASLLQEDAEKKLADAVAQKRKQVEPLFANHAYTEGLAALASLREPVDNFFDHVMVMVEDTKLRDNRLALLSELRNMFLEVADISLLATANA